MLPAITDTPRALEDVVRSAADSHVTSFHAQPLFLKPSSKPVFDAFIAKEFPGLVHAYQARYAVGAFVTSEYRKNFARLVKTLCTRHGIAEHEGELGYRKPAPSAPLQGNLFPGS